MPKAFMSMSGPQEYTPLRSGISDGSARATVDLALTPTKWVTALSTPAGEVGMLTYECMGILAVYFSSGFATNFVWSPLQAYASESLQASSGDITALGLCSVLPLAFRVVMGLISDMVPINRHHRKPYIVCGTALFCAANALGAAATAKVVDFVSVDLLCFVQLMAATGDAWSLLMVDTLVLEKALDHEEVTMRGWMQLKGLMAYYTGVLAGDLLAIAFTTDEIWEWDLLMTKVFFVATVVPLVLVGGTITGLVDDHAERAEAEASDMFGVAPERSGSMVGAVCKHMVQLMRCSCQPIMFLYLLWVCQVENPAWKTYLENSLNLGTVDQDVLTVLGDVAAWLALWAYFSYSFAVNWRSCLTFSVLTCVLVNLTLLLSLGVTSEWLFDQAGYITTAITATTHATKALQKALAYRLLINTCSSKYHASSFALLTSVLYLGATASRVIGSELETVWDVSATTLAVHQYGGLRKLTIACSVLPLLALPFVALVPRGARHQWEQLKSNYAATPPWLAVSYFWSVVVIFLVGLYDVDEEKTSRR